MPTVTTSGKWAQHPVCSAKLLLAGTEVVVLGPLCVSRGSSSLPSFHIGSGCPDPQAYARSIADARLVFEMGAELGHRMHILDLGGGFPGVEGAKVRFEEVTLGSQVSHWAGWGWGWGREGYNDPRKLTVSGSHVLRAVLSALPGLFYY